MTTTRVGEVEAWTIFVLCWAFIGVHTALSWVESRRWGRSPWWRTIVGWLISSAIGSLGTVMGFAVVADLWPALVLLPWFMWAYLVAVGGVAVAVAGHIVARVWLHVRARRAAE